MGKPTRNLKRKQNLVDSKIAEIEEVPQANERESDDEPDSGLEDLLALDFKNNDQDSTDGEGELNEDQPSDTEREEVLFGSDDESEELEFLTDSEEGNESKDASESEKDTNSDGSIDSGEYEDESDSNVDDSIENSYGNDSKSDDKTVKKSLIKSFNGNAKTMSNIVSKKDNKDNKKDISQTRNSTVESKQSSNKSNASKVGNVKINKVTIKEPNSKNIGNVQEDKIMSDWINSSRHNEYEYDSSDEEDIRNTVGNIPMKWYEDYPHIGYDWEGKRIMKPEKGDQLDNFLKRMENPDFWRTIKDPQTGQDVILSEADIELITRIQKQKIPDVQFDEYAPWVEWFTSEVMKMPLRKFPEHKRSFVPSKPEAKKVSKLVHALKMGWIKSTAEMQKEREQKKGEHNFYMLWETDDQEEEMRRIHKHIPAPKRHLPGNAESYNPPPEYLFDKRELKEWNKLKATPWKRKLHFIPLKYNSLREVPAYPKYVKERFQRCMDLYLCPRAIKMRLAINPEDLVPQLPNPKDLQPFPTTMCMVFKGHADMVRSISAEAKGQYIASGSDDMTLKVWEVATGRCIKTVPCGGVVRSVAWCPNQAISLIAVAADRKVLLINPGVGDRLITGKTDQLLEIIPQSDAIVSERVKTAVQWEQAEGESRQNGIRIILNHFKTIQQVTWHAKGDYFATVMPDGQNRSVLINQLSKRRSQVPFSKAKGLVQCVLFHPIRPFLFVATQRNVRIYDLMKQEMVKKLLSNSQWISNMAIHPGGDNLLVSTYDRKMLWFDLDLSTKPYQTLRLHGTGVRGVAFHKRYPLFASGADDRGLIVSHGMVYNDLMQNPLIVPLKRLCDHELFNDFGILDVAFHPVQPWVFSAGADSTIRMYS
ncbi:ribosome biogenesis protein BOP1 homolog [Orussus abietinus]|uniref:ribosome biogenesis protein BOP1 homolog n=1 Tax=Orussus abietinus TaxID=222816 RepID=UPI000625130B|nr:ribosome biogenesis protein BOP1 homolog [Orussus abietinus]